MLNYSDFQPYQSQKNKFKFKKLIPIDDSPGKYSEMFTKKVYQVTVFNNHQHFATLHSLYKKNIFQNIAGFFRRKNNTFYCISTINDFELLSQFVEKYRGQKQLINQLFCLQLVQEILNMAKQIQSSGLNIKILSPNYIIITENTQRKFRFKLKFPFAHDFFSNLSLDVVEREKQFCAPQILSFKFNDPLKDNEQFPKACLYSLGLILLYSFGYRIKSQERISALKKSKQFDIFLKALRKEIKMLLEGKFISKIIKILLQSNESVRDTLQTFLLKLKSPQLNSLRKYNFKSSLQSEKDVYIPTIFSENEQIKPSGLNKTIQIRGSSNSTYKRSLQTEQKGPNTYQMNLFASFKKSADHYYHNNSIQQVQEEQVIRNDDKQDKQDTQNNGLGMPSPIEIDIDWDDEENLQQSNSKRILIDQSNKISKSKQKYLYSPNSINKSVMMMQQITLSPIANLQKTKQMQRQLIQMTLNIKKHEDVQSIFDLNKPLQNKIQQQPQIIKYNSHEFDLKLSKKSEQDIKRKKSKSQLNDMKLVYKSQDEQEQEEEQIALSPRNTRNNIVLIKEQFSKKSQGIFIVFLVTFLVYKVIDYFVKDGKDNK